MTQTKPKDPKKKKPALKETWDCPNGFTGHKVISRGPQIYCKECDQFKNKSDALVDQQFSLKFETDGENAVVVASTDKPIKTLPDLIEVCQIDTTIWNIDKYSQGKSAGYRKDRKSKFLQKNGKNIHSEVVDSGKVVVVPLYSVKAWLSRKTPEIRDRSAILDLIKDAKKYSPKAPRIKLKSFVRRQGCVYEMDLPDIHFGKLTWAEESGQDYDIKLAREMALNATEQLLEYAQIFQNVFPIKEIIMPWGNDFFNVDTKQETTTGGTPQQEDTRWKKTFREGRLLSQEIIERATSIAPVRVIMMPGNHDEQRLFFLGEALEAWFHNNPNVSVDNSPRSRKYYSFGKVLLGFAHGNAEKLEKLPTIMSLEQKEAWGRSEFREWHLGDKHTRRQYDLKHEEQLANTIRVLSSLSSTDVWHYDNGFIGNVRAATAFLWHPERGLAGEFHAVPGG